MNKIKELFRFKQLVRDILADMSDGAKTQDDILDSDIDRILNSEEFRKTYLKYISSKSNKNNQEVLEEVDYVNIDGVDIRVI